MCSLQLIDLSMNIPEDPKEPFFSSVLPWILLHRIIKHEEAAFHCMLRKHIPLGDEEGPSGSLSGSLSCSLSLPVSVPLGSSSLLSLS